MGNISENEFLLRQPSFPQHSETDAFYLGVANRIYQELSSDIFSVGMPDGVSRRIALGLSDYMQDIVSDAGFWRSFVEANRKLYGWSVPFHTLSEDYIDYELNREDVRFIVWYIVSMLWEDKRYIYPHDSLLLDYADKCFAILDSVYEDAPVNESFNIARGLEFNDPDDRSRIYHLGNWLFLHSYIMTPAFSMTLREILSEVDPKDDDHVTKLNDLLEEAMMQVPTGPLALYTPEWTYLIVEGKLPESNHVAKESPHPYYEAFMNATGGEDIMYFDSYDSMNEFFIKSLGWESGVEHLKQSKGAHDYVLMVNREKGMLMARDVARCIKSQSNTLYDSEYAKLHAFELISVRGRCPGDLLHRIIENGWLPDAHFPDSDDTGLVKDNMDFIARCYLQLYYRGD